MLFLDKSEEPYKYYLATLRRAVKSMIRPSKDQALADRIFEKLMKDFMDANTDLPPASIYPNHPQRLLNLVCYVSEYVFKDALLTALTDGGNRPNLSPGFAVEYYSYDFVGEFTSKEKPYQQNEYHGYYVKSRNTLWENIKSQKVAREALTKPDKNGKYVVIDFKELDRRIRGEIRYYYSEHPELCTTVTPDEDVKKIFGTILGELCESLMKANTSQYGTSYYH